MLCTLLLLCFINNYLQYNNALTKGTTKQVDIADTRKHLPYLAIKVLSNLNIPWQVICTLAKLTSGLGDVKSQLFIYKVML